MPPAEHGGHDTEQQHQAGYQRQSGGQLQSVEGALHSGGRDVGQFHESRGNRRPNPHTASSDGASHTEPAAASLDARSARATAPATTTPNIGATCAALENIRLRNPKTATPSTPTTTECDAAEPMISHPAAAPAAAAAP